MDLVWTGDVGCGNQHAIEGRPHPGSGEKNRAGGIETSLLCCAGGARGLGHGSSTSSTCLPLRQAWGRVGAGAGWKRSRQRNERTARKPLLWAWKGPDSSISSPPSHPERQTCSFRNERSEVPNSPVPQASACPCVWGAEWAPGLEPEPPHGPSFSAHLYLTRPWA